MTTTTNGNKAHIMHFEGNELVVGDKFRKKAGDVLLVLTALFACFLFFQSKNRTVELLENEQQKVNAIQALLDSTDFGFALVDDKGHVIDWSPALERMTGWTQADLRNGLEPVMDTKHWDKHCEGFQDVMRHNKRKSPRTLLIYCDLKPKDGTNPDIPVRVTVRIVDFDDKKRYAVVNIEKVDDIKRVAPINVSSVVSSQAIQTMEGGDPSE